MTFKVHRKLWHFSVLAAAVALPLMAMAQGALVFERATLAIESPPLDEKEKNPKPQHPTLKYDVEVRAEEALRLEYIHTLNSLSGDTGVLIHFAAPSIAALPAMKVYTPVDALFITEDGTVVQILPNVILGDITQNLQAKMPVKAFLFLKAGEAGARGIHPRDTVTGSVFVPAPAMQE